MANRSRGRKLLIRNGRSRKGASPLRRKSGQRGIITVRVQVRDPKRPPNQSRPKARPKLKKGGPGQRTQTRRRAETNTTFVIYRSGNSPPTSPDVTATDGALIARFWSGSEASEGDQDFRWTHVLEVNDDVDLRDDWPNDPPTNHDVVYVPDENGTAFEVIFVELIHRGEPEQFKRVYLNRQAPTWPTNEL